MYESTVIPMDTMIPVTPARSKLGAIEVCPRAEMITHNNAAVTTRPLTMTRPSNR